MEVYFKNKKLEKQLTEPRELQRAFGQLAKVLMRRLGELQAADTLEDILKLGSPRLHQHVGNRAGCWTVDLSANYRLVFEIADEPIPRKLDNSVDLAQVKQILITSVEDPH